MEVELAIERTGLSVGVATDAAGVPETVLGAAGLASSPGDVALPPRVPVVADRA